MGLTRTGGLNAQRRRRAWWMLAPLLAVLSLVGGWPLLRTVWFGLTDAEWSRPGAPRFVGLDNYIGDYGLLSSPDWWQAVGNTLVFTVLSVSLETALGLGVALLLNRPSRLRTAPRPALLVPWAIPTVVSAKLWSWMLHDQYGIVNHLLLALGLSLMAAWSPAPGAASAMSRPRCCSSSSRCSRSPTPCRARSSRAATCSRPSCGRRRRPWPTAPRCSPTSRSR